MKKNNISKYYIYVQNFSSRLHFWNRKLLANLKVWKSYQLRVKTWRSPKVIIGSVILFSIIVSLSVYLNGTASAAYIFLNGQKIGLVMNVDEGQHIVQDILTKRGQAIGKVAKTHDSVEFELARVKKVELIQEIATENELSKKINSYIDGYALEIAGTQFAILPSQEDIHTVLKSYQDYYTKPSDSNKVSSAEFSELISIKPIEAELEQVKLPGQVLKALEDGNITTTEYTVRENDSWWQIARTNNMRTKEVLAGNPGMTEDSILKVGQKIKLVAINPYLTIMSKGTLTTTEIVPFDVVTKTDTKLASGATAVQQQGTDGSKVVTYTYLQKNGENISKQVVEEKVTQEPVTQVIAQGPKSTPTSVAYGISRGSGTISGIAWPLRGAINSYYGSRWGKFHTGIDIDGDTGEPYYAAASGTVVSAGWGGNYGNMILIDHGNGVRTRYGHSSKLLVTAGQHVTKGQVIGLVGSTGNSTGPHLHFEIIRNGETVNPLSYLR